MSAAWFEPLKAMDRQFLVMEDENRHMHTSGFSLYELAPLRSEAGSVDMQAFRGAIEAALERIPRYRQKLAWTPLDRHPVWIDAADFALDDHLHHLSLPRPGSKAQLQQVVGWIVSQPLDPARPLWEMWVVEGVDHGKCFAVVTKMHHCMVDGGAGMNLVQLLLRAKPAYRTPAAKPFVPRPAPSRAELARYDLSRRIGAPLRLLRGLRDFGAGSDVAAALRERLSAVGQLLQNVTSASKTPISGEALGARRRADWIEMPLDELTKLRRDLGCSLNDLVLAIVAGAVRRYLDRRGVALAGLDFRVSIPVNVRSESESGEMGNRTSSWIVPLPLAEADPAAQLAAISSLTGELKDTHQALGVEMMMAAAEEIPALLSLAARAIKSQISMIVTNVPGPPLPLYMLGCRALSMQPLVPLFPGVGIGVALLSYDGVLYWGFLADYAQVPDLDSFVADIRNAHQALDHARSTRGAA